GVGHVAAKALGQHEAYLEVLGFLGGAERQEELGIHANRARLQAEPYEQRRVFTEPRIRAPRAAAPHESRGFTRLPRAALEIEATPRDLCLGVPAEALGLAVELSDRGHLRLEPKREALLHEALLL